MRTILTGEPLFVLRGRVESRRVLRPARHAPRMEISFSGATGRGSLGAGSGACTFIAQANAESLYAWRGRGVMFFEHGSVSTRSWGEGRRDGNTLTYQGRIAFRAHAASLAWLDIVEAEFEYRQDMSSLSVTLDCHAPPACAGPHIPVHQPQGDISC